jgi:hypothetical protein
MNALIQWAIRTLGGITKEQWVAALSFVLRWAGSRLSSEEKKAKVLEALAKIGIEGSTANYLVEAAYKWLKRIGQVPA